MIKMIKLLEKNKWLAITFTILIAIEIFYFSSISGGEPSPKAGGINLTIIYHLIVFFLFNFFLLTSVIGKKEVKGKYLLIVLALSIVYSLSDEVHQLFVPFRVFDIQDILINNIGIFSSTILYLYHKRSSQ
jgi:VanZ family protein